MKIIEAESFDNMLLIKAFAEWKKISEESPKMEYNPSMLKHLGFRDIKINENGTFDANFGDSRYKAIYLQNFIEEQDEKMVKINVNFKFGEIFNN